MKPTIEVRPPADNAELQQALDLRQQVFVVEEGRDRFVDADEVDQTCQHFVAVEDGQVIGTLRLYQLHPGDIGIKIGRVAVQKERRGQGIGTQLMLAAHAWAEGNYDSVYLHSQVAVVDFYKKLGYQTEGKIFVEAGTEHIVMRLPRMTSRQ
jgi:predicted GNAT family N-acyltransferase